MTEKEAALAREQAIADEMAAYYNAEGDYMDGSTVRRRLGALWDRAQKVAHAVTPHLEEEQRS